MDYIEKIIKEGVNEKGFLSKDVMKILKSTTPVFCVDAVIVPESNRPEAVLFYRNDKESANPNQYWIVGGRQRLGECMETTAERKIYEETGLEINISPDDQLFAHNIIHKKGENGIWYSFFGDVSQEDARNLYHTPVVCYIARTPSYEKIKEKIVAQGGHNNFKLFLQAESFLDKYVQKAMKVAWRRIGFRK